MSQPMLLCFALLAICISSCLAESIICSNIITPSISNDRGHNGGCRRYIRGYDVTGVTNTVVLTHSKNGINDECDCIEACLKAKNTCASWVWKFTDTSGFRTCTLYSNFNFPPDTSANFGKSHLGSIAGNPQAGGQVPHCTKDGTDDGPADNSCYSGALWFLDNGKFLC